MTYLQNMSSLKDLLSAEKAATAPSPFTPPKDSTSGLWASSQNVPEKLAAFLDHSGIPHYDATDFYGLTRFVLKTVEHGKATSLCPNVTPISKNMVPIAVHALKRFSFGRTGGSASSARTVNAAMSIGQRFARITNCRMNYPGAEPFLTRRSTETNPRKSRYSKNPKSRVAILILLSIRLRARLTAGSRSAK
jgi:hypothetical protein